MKTVSNKSTKATISPWVIISGLSVLGLGGGAYWYLTRDNKVDKTSSDILALPNTNLSYPKSQKSKKYTPKQGSKGLQSKHITPYIKYGSRHPDVKVLQRFLIFKKANIGRTGSNRDGVDGIYGPKTLRAAKQYLKKTQFSRKDINGMKVSLKKFGLK